MLEKEGDKILRALYKYPNYFVFYNNVIQKPFFISLGEFPYIICKESLNQRFISGWVILILAINQAVIFESGYSEN